MGRKRIPNKKESLNISVLPDLIKKLDDLLQGKPRSPFVADLIEKEIKNKKRE